MHKSTDRCCLLELVETKIIGTIDYVTRIGNGRKLCYIPGCVQSSAKLCLQLLEQKLAKKGELSASYVCTIDAVGKLKL